MTAGSLVSSRQSTGGASSGASDGIPTLITYGQRSVRARIDHNVPVDEIIRQLCSSPQLSVQEPAALFALRDAANDELITDDTLALKLQLKASLKLCAAPVLEAADTIDKLMGEDKQAVKQATFSLRAFLKEEAFVNEFIKRNGVKALASVIQTATGNTLAYALNAMQTLLDMDYGWEDLNESFVAKIVAIIPAQALVNIVRPALSLLRKLVMSDHTQFGFNAVWPIMSAKEDFFRSIAQRITREGDKLLTGGALALLNAIMRNISKEYFDEAVETLESYAFRKAVINLIENRAEDLTPPVLQFQQNCANIWHEQELTPVDIQDSAHLRKLEIVYSLSGIDTSDGQARDFRKLGFSKDLPDLVQDLEGVGMFGLSALHHVASQRTEEFSKMVLEQVNRSDARRCPIAMVSIQVSKILSEQFDLSGSLASASFQPFLLDYYRIHYVVMEFFVRMFSDSGATVADFHRVATLTTSQVRLTIGKGALDYQSSSQERDPKTFFDIKHEFTEAKYEDVRDRQMKEMEVEDDLLSKLPVRNLRDRLYRESFEFVRQQRINCMHVGRWFTCHGPSANAGTVASRQRAIPTLRHRFYRLAANKRYLHWVETGEKQKIGPGIDDLPNRIDLSTVNEVAYGGVGNERLSTNISRTQSSVASPSSQDIGSPNMRSPPARASSTSNNPLTITLLGADTVLAEFIAPDQATLSEWVDGLNLLLPDGYIATKETADYIQALTDIGVKIRLLDLTGERLDIPAALPIPIVPPATVPFFYAE